MLAKTSRLVTVVCDFKLASFLSVRNLFRFTSNLIDQNYVQSRAAVFLRSLCTFIARNKTVQLFFRFREAQRFARNILNHQTFERPSLGNLRNGSVPSAFVDCLEKALSRALSSETQKELNLSSNYTRIPEKVVRKSADGLKYSEQTFAFLLLEI